MANEKRKFNIIDGVIVAIVIIVVAGGVWFFAAGRGGEPAYVYYTVELRHAPRAVVDTWIAIEPYAQVRDSVRNYYLGRIINVTYENEFNINFDHGLNIFREIDVPERYRIEVIIRGRGSVSPSIIHVEGVPVRVGMNKYLRGFGFAGGGYVINMEVIEVE